jgi:uncharacterized membrane protein
MSVRTDHDGTGAGDVERRLRRAKRPVTTLAGPYGHPLHPVLVTVPIGAWVASIVFDLASHAADDASAFAIGAYWLVALGIAGALLAASIGTLDLLALTGGTRAFRTALLHVALNLAVVALFAVSLVVRGRPDAGSDATSVGIVVLSVIALAGLGAAGWLGGRLSFHYGVRVADEATQSEGYLVHQGDD